MPDTGTNETICYNSRFTHGVDDKRRVQIPAKWRPSQPDVELTLILWPNGAQADACLLVLPPAEMNKLAAKIRAMPLGDQNASALRRSIGSKSASVTVDKAGRICLPEFMAKDAMIGSEALLIGLLDCFQIWNPERYKTVEAMDAVVFPEALKLI